MLVGTDPHARVEAVRLLLAVVDDDEPALERICADAATRPDGTLALLLATVHLAYEGAVAGGGPGWRTAAHLTAWAATPDDEDDQP